ncbi:hypothetical protein MNBD_GAMMA17-845 [hydrothermal vent metagenome]|uniref:Uncharacterized protein n=1 Tax=hydrothermal vent metagenome TaxID=652676 RepID=A0A3B0ZNS0_9ZZZZ
MRVNDFCCWLVVSGASLFSSSLLYAQEIDGVLSEDEIKAVVADRDVINLDGVQIRGNKELPQILYIVPWQDIETKRRVQEQDIVLFSLTERRIKPVMPNMNKVGSRL